MKPLILTGLSVAILLLALAPWSLAQDEKPSPAPNEKAEQIMQRALKVVGGDRYLQVKTQIGRGFFTEFRDGSRDFQLSLSITLLILTKSELNSPAAAHGQFKPTFAAAAGSMTAPR